MLLRFCEPFRSSYPTAKYGMQSRYSCGINAPFQLEWWLIDVRYDTNMLLEARLQGEKIMNFLPEHGADPDGPGLADSVLAALFSLGVCRFRYEMPRISEVQLLLDHGAEINGARYLRLKQRSIQERCSHH